MKLNQFQKQAIVAAIFQDVPVAKSAHIHEAVQAALVKVMSPECRRAYKACPKALRTARTYDITYERDAANFVIGDANFEEVIRPWIEAKEKYKDAEKRLRAVVDSCSTLKQLTEVLPEFVSYFPSEHAPTKNLPAIANVVTDLMNLGWKAPNHGC